MNNIKEEIELATQLHNWYEEISKEKGWDTQPRCKVEFVDLPDGNKEVMIEMAHRIIEFKNKEFREAIESQLSHNPNHYCKKYGEQFKECVLCFFERIIK